MGSQLRNSRKHQGSLIHLMEAGGDGLKPGRLQQLLVQYEQTLRMSTVVSNQQGPSEDQAGQGQYNSYNFVLHKRALVPYYYRHVGRQASTDPEEPGLASTRK
ncbi:hypothetical protein BG015_004695 [Linnemannia schmuckeri]|uniref:Uncharacterized protein n=1 Tax=Linnemannia schmuckeri TaxID=64567 RepID=A0A9P5RB00_9FUNG|nr:hypothetical protein BG015_004695 [Linnemannia schmuckeri]